MGRASMLLLKPIGLQLKIRIATVIRAGAGAWLVVNQAAQPHKSVGLSLRRP